MNEELKPCPFCGCQDVALVENDKIPFRLGSYTLVTYAFCTGCGAQTGAKAGMEAAERAIEGWNRRAATEALTATPKPLTLTLHITGDREDAERIGALAAAQWPAVSGWSVTNE
jgi:Lar family restriction alleviation protein